MRNRLKRSLSRHRTVNEIFILLTAVMVAVLYILFSLAFNERLLSHLVNPVIDAVTLFSGLLLLGVIVYFFAVPFLTYMNRLLIERRAREFAMLRLFGLSAGRLAAQLALELLTVGILGLALGLFLGVLLSKAVGMVLVRLLNRAVTVPLLLDGDVFFLVIVLFGALFLLLGLLNWLYVQQLPLSRFARGESTAQKMPAATWWRGVLATLGLLLTTVSTVGFYHMIGWTSHLSEIRPGSNLGLFWFGLFIVLIIGDFWLFRYTLPLTFLWLSKRRAVRGRATRLLVTVNLAKRLHQNSRSTFLTAMLATLTVLVIGGGTVLFQFGQDTVEQSAPLPIVATNSGHARLRSAVNQGILTQQGKLETKLLIGELRSNQSAGDRTLYNAVRLSDYNKLIPLQKGLKPLSLKPGTAAIAITGGSMYRQTWLSLKESWRLMPKAGGPTLKLVSLQKDFPLGSDAYFERALIVSDADYARLIGTVDPLFYYRKEDNRTLTGIALNGREYASFDTATLDGTKKTAITRQADTESQGRPNVVERATLVDTMTTLFGFGLFIAIIMGAVFMLGTAAMLLLKQLILGTQERGLRQKLVALGMTPNHTSKVVSWQTVIIFLLPLLIGALNAGLVIRLMATVLDNPSYVVTISVLLCYVVVYLLFAALCARLITQGDRTRQASSPSEASGSTIS